MLRCMFCSGTMLKISPISAAEKPSALHVLNMASTSSGRRTKRRFGIVFFTLIPPVSAKAPAKPTSVKAVVKKSTKKKKTVTLTWKKIKSASGYRVTISTKTNKGFKKLADVKKTKLTFKKKKGTYYVKVKAYIASGNKRIYSKASKTLKIKVK